MPPRSKKNAAAAAAAVDSSLLALPPVILVLKVSKEFVESVQNVDVASSKHPQPANDDASRPYSDILRESLGHGQQRFDENVIHDLVSRLHLAHEYSADTACFWCCHGFSNKAFVVPTHYDTHSNTYRAEGNFCSPECGLAYTYSEARLTQNDRWLRHSLMNSLYGSLYPGSEIQPAPDKRILRMFGGTLDIQQYREFLFKSTKPLQSAMPPVRLYMPSVNTQVSTRDVKSYVALTVETVDKASQQLRLRRNKPVHEGIPTLDKCLGVK
jgi:hypothetical protein